MDIKELKKNILDKNMSDKFLIFIDENSFLSKQYIKEISKIRKLKLEYIDDINIALSKDSMFSVDDTLYIYTCDTFDIDIDKTSNLIVMCKKVSKDLKDKFSDDMIEFPKLIDWQIEDYCKVKAKGVEESDIKWLMNICKNDIYRIDNELNKIAIFDERLRKAKFKEFIRDKVFSDLSSYTIFSLSNAIITKNIEELKHIYNEIENIDINAIGLVTVLYNNFKNIINIQLGVNPTAESLGMNPKQFMALRYRINHYSKNQLISIFDMLTSIDKRLKTSQLPANYIIDYIILKILSFDNNIRLYKSK